LPEDWVKVNSVAPHFYLSMEINMDNAIAARTAINAVSPVKISFNDLIIKAAAHALRQHPDVNSSWMGDFIRAESPYSHWQCRSNARWINCTSNKICRSKIIVANCCRSEGFDMQKLRKKVTAC
jgi:hypothetical protein